MKPTLQILFLLLLSGIFGSTTGFSQLFTFESKVVGDPRVIYDHMGHHGGNAIFGDYMVGSAHFHDNVVGATTFLNSGIAYLYHWNDTTCHWDQIDVIFPETAIGVFDFEAGSEFGSSVALENDLIAIGSSNRDAPPHVNAGVVYIYRIVGDEAVFVETLIPLTNALTDDRQTFAGFGSALKMHGGQLIVSAPRESQADGLPNMNNAGAAYIYEWNNSTSSFEFQNKLTPSDRYSDQLFGNEVSVFGNHAVVAAQYTETGIGADPVAINAGAVYVFEKDASTGIWSQTQKLVAFDREAGDVFGSSVDMTQQHIIIGSRLEDPSGFSLFNNEGSAYTYIWNDISGIFDFEQKLNPTDFNPGDQFGYYVAISNDKILIGAPYHDFDTDNLDFRSQAGVAYLFEFSAGAWLQTLKLDAFDRQNNDNFGEVLSINGNRLMVGAWGQSLNEEGLPPLLEAAGAIYTYNLETKPVINDLISDQIGSCLDIPVNLAVDGVLYDAYGWEWHKDSCGGEVIDTAATITVNPTETTTYCVRALGCYNYVEEEDCHCIEVEAGEDNWHQTTLAGLYEKGNAVKTDSEGNVYVTGIYQGYALFDGGDNTNVLVDADPSFTYGIKSYVAKYDNCANLMWVAYASGNGSDDYSRDIALHESGDYLFIVGEFENQIVFNHGIGDFGFGAGTVTRTRTGKNGYVARINMTTGKVDYVDAVWSDGASSNLTAIGINEDNGRIIVAGQTYNSAGNEKVFIRKYAPSYSTIGPDRFHVQSTTYNGAIVNAIDYDEDSPLGSGEYGSFWVFGDFRTYFNISSAGGATFFPLSSTNTERDAFVIKYYDHNGSPGAPVDDVDGIFLKRGNIENLAGRSMTGMDIAVDKATGNAYMTGTKRGSVTAAFGLGGHNLPNVFGQYTGYIISMRYDGGIAPAALAQLARPDGPSPTYGYGITVVEDKVYFTGNRRIETYFEDLLGASYLSFTGFEGEDLLMYIAAYSTTDGSFLWANGTTNPFPPALPENAYHYPGAVTADHLGYLFIAGSFQAHMGYMVGAPTSGNLYYSSNAGSVFTMRVDIEGADETALQSPVFGEPEIEAEDNLTDETIQLTLIPNPTTKQTRINLVNSDPEKVYNLKVIGVDGRVIYEGELKNGNLLLDCSNFASGLYTVWVSDENSTYSVKLLKTN